MVAGRWRELLCLLLKPGAIECSPIGTRHTSCVQNGLSGSGPAARDEGWAIRWPTHWGPKHGACGTEGRVQGAGILGKALVHAIQDSGLCCCCSSQQQQKAHNNQTLEKADPYKHLALEILCRPRGDKKAHSPGVWWASHSRSRKKIPFSSNAP